MATKKGQKQKPSAKNDAQNGKQAKSLKKSGGRSGARETSSGSERSSLDPRRARSLRADETTTDDSKLHSSGKLSGDLESLSEQELSDSESVAELAEEGQDLEGELVKGVEDTPGPEQGAVRTHTPTAPETEDVPEYKNRGRL
jgi:hypothetical protein